MVHISPSLATTPVILTPDLVTRGEGRKLLLVVAHADDPAFFVGGTCILWANAGWHIICLRVTDDRWDSVGLSEEETIRQNDQEFRDAAVKLGIAEIVDLHWQTDVLGDTSRVKLRERIIHAIRKHQPYGLVTFDPNSMFYEDNLDHKVLAEAVDEAYWTAKFDKHHPEHFDEGLAPHACVECWYFGRTVVSVTHVFDISSVLEQQMQAILCHRTMLANMVHQMSLEAKTRGARNALVEQALSGDLRPLFETLLVGTAKLRAEPFGLAAAEALRRHAATLPDAALKISEM